MNSNTKDPIRKVVIVGGGSSGWMSAAALANALCGQCEITLIESDEIGTVGVGEATIPPIKLFNQQLGINEQEFLQATQGTLKLGIEFINWYKQGESYFHPFGDFGADFDQVPLHHYWLQAQQQGNNTPLFDYSLAWCAARAGKVVPYTRDRRLIQSTADYAYHFDAGLYARYLGQYAQKRGVKRIEGKIEQVHQHPDSGFITAVSLHSGEKIEGDLFIDCSGFRALLMTALNVGYEDWSHWLPCNSAQAVACSRTDGEIKPFTQSTARSAGWQWRIPLQHRTGNGHVYAREFSSDDEACATLLNNLDAPALGEPRQLRFVTGHRRQFWAKNCVAVGLASGFMEPLESTSLHLVQTAIRRLLALFPHAGFDPLAIEEFNRITLEEYEGIRDFLILHYKANNRTDSIFWQHCAAMEIPDSLSYKIKHFASGGRLVSTRTELFLNPSWLAVLIGQGVQPAHYAPLADLRTAGTANSIDAKARLAHLRRAIDEAVANLPGHQQYLQHLQQTATK